jgi:hypothetical protein
MTSPAGPPVIAAQQTTTTYETLRAAVLDGHANGQRGIATIIHRGLTAWIGEQVPASQPAAPGGAATIRPARPTIHATTNELTRLLAGILIALTTGDTHAHT